MVSAFVSYDHTDIVTLIYTEVATTVTMVMESNITTADPPTASGEWFQKEIRNILLWIVLGFGLVGNLLVILKLYINRRRKSRVNTIVFGIASADMSVCLFAILPTVIIEMHPEWRAGNAFCKLVMFLQGAALISTGNMVMILALDRHHAVRSPLKEFFTAWKLVACGWGAAFTLAVPQLFVWETYENRQNITKCSTPMLRKEEYASFKMLYLTYVAIITFFIPLVVMTVAYCRIFKKIHDKAQETTGKKSTKKGHMEMNRTGGTGALTKAKKKTLMMSIVIISTFIICSVPFFIIEMLGIYVPQEVQKIPNVYALFSIMAVANSATNPYVFLLFNITRGFVVELQGAFCPCCCPKNDQGDYSRYSVKFSTSSNSRHNNSRVCDHDHVTRLTDVHVGTPKLEVKKSDSR